MKRCWTVEPTSERIMQDINALPNVLQTIIERQGCVVKDEYLRTGRRARRADYSGALKNKRRSRQRKSTLKDLVCHPDALEAKNKLCATVRQAIMNEVMLEMVHEEMDNEDVEGKSDED